MRLRHVNIVLRALLTSGLVSLGSTTVVSADSPGLTVHGVTSLVTDVHTCDTQLEVGFRFEIAGLPLSNGRIDGASVSAQTARVDGAPAAAYGTRTDFSAAPFYFATLHLEAAAPGPHVLSLVGGQNGITWRAFDHANPGADYIAHLDADYSLSFVVPECGSEAAAEFSDFAAPIDAAPTLNVVRRGVTVPIRFSVSMDGVALSNPADLSVSTARVSCERGVPTDMVERLAPSTRTNELFYSADTQLFVYRWSVPRGNHPCWDVTFTHDSGVSTTAHFRTYGR